MLQRSGANMIFCAYFATLRARLARMLSLECDDRTAAIARHVVGDR
jgi:hypothetical protein